METRAAILNKKAGGENIDLPSDVCHFLARHIHSNVRILEGSLTRIKAFADMSNQTISIDMCKNVLKDILGTKRSFISIEEVIRCVAKHYGLKPGELKSPKRAKPITRARQVAMYLCRELTSESFPEIGSRFGGRDHATVIHGVNKITALLEVDSDLQSDIQLLGKSLMA
jgi:chromosomal replication initiator protein